MASQPPEINDTNEDKEFDDVFAEYAAGKKPADIPPEPVEPEPEGSEPEEPASAEEAPAEVPPEETAPPASAEGAEEAPTEAAPDPWAHLSPEDKARVLELQRERDEFRHRAASDANRVAALSRKLQLQRVASVPETPAQPSEAKKVLDEKIVKLREDYGAIADPLIELIEAQRDELSAVKTVVHDVATERQAEAIQAETRVLAERHPDWHEIGQSPEFAGWLQVQPENIQRLAQSWDARETGVVLTLFKTERAEITRETGAEPQAAPAAEEPKPAPAQPDARRSAQLEAGRDVRSRPAPAASGPPEDFYTAFDYFVQKRAAQSKR